MLERRLHRTLGDFVEGHSLDAGRRGGLAFFCFLRFLLLCPVSVKLAGKVRSNGLALAVRVRRKVNRIRRGGQLLQLGDNLFFAGDDDVVRLKIVADVHTQSALGQVFDVPQGGFDGDSTMTKPFDNVSSISWCRFFETSTNVNRGTSYGKTAMSILCDFFPAISSLRCFTPLPLAREFGCSLL